MQSSSDPRQQQRGFPELKLKKSNSESGDRHVDDSAPLSSNRSGSSLKSNTYNSSFNSEPPIATELTSVAVSTDNATSNSNVSSSSSSSKTKERKSRNLHVLGSPGSEGDESCGEQVGVIGGSRPGSPGQSIGDSSDLDIIPNPNKTLDLVTELKSLDCVLKEPLKLRLVSTALDYSGLYP